MTRKRKLLIFLVTLGCGVALLALLGVLFYRSFLAPYFAMREVPPELRETKILVGADFLTKSEFYGKGKKGSLLDLLDKDELKIRLSSIAAMSVGQLDGQPGLDVGLAGRYAMLILDAQGNVKERIVYQFEKGEIKIGPLKTERMKDNFFEIRIVDVESDGVCEILGYDGMDGAALFNHQGSLLFSRGAHQEGRAAIKEVAAGDIDGDGKLEFVAAWGYEPWSGIEMFDRFGRSKWVHQEEFKPGQLEIVDVDGDGKPEIVEENGGGLKIRDAGGKVLRSASMPVRLNHLSLCPRDDGRSPAQHLVVDEGKLMLIDLDGKNFSTYEAPLSKIKLEKPRTVTFPGMDEPFVFETEEAYRAKGVWVKLKPDQNKYLAAVARFSGIDRSLFYVYDEQGKLVYHEILPEDCNSIAAIASEHEGSEAVLVGGETSVWRYAAAR